MASARDRMTWAALALVVGALLGGLLVMPEREGGPVVPFGRQVIPATVVPATARVQNAGTEAVVVTMEAWKDAERVKREEPLTIPPGGEGRFPLTLEEDGTYRLEASFQLARNPRGTAYAETTVTVGSCGPDRSAGVLFRVSGTRSGVRVDGMDPSCF